MPWERELQFQKNCVFDNIYAVDQSYYDPTASFHG